MTRWKNSIETLNKCGISTFDIPENIFRLFRDSAYSAKEAGVKMKGNLAGKIKEEYSIKKNVGVDELINDYLLHSCFLGPSGYLLSKIDVLTEPLPVVLDDIWCNFQKKHEYNPLHDHTGISSFIVFVNIPYDLEEEENYFGEGKGGKNSCNSKLSFINFGNTQFGPKAFCVDVDKSFEGKMIMFSAKYNHLVYPFYTSDDYRITISGNFKFKVV